MGSQQETEKQLSILDNNLRDIPGNMRMFTLCMRSLYAEQSLGSNTETARNMSKLRDATRKHAMVYLKGVLPISTSLIRSIRDFFEYYEVLDLEEWGRNLPDILDDVRGYKQCCAEVVRLHEDIMTDLKKREDEAKVYFKELKDLKEEYEKEKKKFEAKARTKRGWGFGLATLPGISIFASPILRSIAENDLAVAVAKGAQGEIYGSAAFIIESSLIPALSAFIDGLSSCAGFFSVVENEMESFQTKGNKAVESDKILHYNLVKKKAASIGKSCQQFYAMIPGVKTDLLCIPDSGTDDNYVDKWLKEQQQTIRNKYGGALGGAMKKMITYFTTDDLEEQLDKCSNLET